MTEMKKMLNRLVILLAVLAMALFSCGVPTKVPQQAADGFARRAARMELMTKMKLATVKVVLPDLRLVSSGILLRQGTKASMLLIAGHTARHAVGNRGYAQGAVGPRCPIVAVRISKRYDLALARVKCSLPGVPAVLAPRPPDLGETVYVLGHTLGKPYTLTKGIVSSTHRQLRIGTKSRFHMQVSAQSLGGNSGGPAFDSRGRLIGVLSGGPFAPVWTPFGRDMMRMVMVPHMALCVPLQHIRNFLAHEGVLQQR
jgi:hypothetical protein